MFSLVLFGVLLVAGIFFLVFFAWKMRALRRAMNSGYSQSSGFSAGRATPDGENKVIEGEFVRVDESPTALRHIDE